MAEFPRQRQSAHDKITTTENAFTKDDEKVETTEVVSTKGESVGKATEVSKGGDDDTMKEPVIIEPDDTAHQADTSVVDEMKSSLESILVKCLALPNSDHLQNFLLHVNNAIRQVEPLKADLRGVHVDE